jgi:hypothetical protein
MIHQAKVTDRLPIAILKISPVSIVLEVSKAVWNNRFPVVRASWIPI